MEKNYVKEKKAAAKEFEDKKIELKENLIAELEEKKKMIENEKLTMELTGGKNKICYFSSPLHYCLEKKLKKNRSGLYWQLDFKTSQMSAVVEQIGGLLVENVVCNKIRWPALLTRKSK